MYRKVSLLLLALALAGCNVLPVAKDEALLTWTGWPEVNGLRFESYYQPLDLGPILVWLYIENTTNVPLTVLTTPGGGEPDLSSGPDNEDICYEWHMQEEDGTQIVHSMASYDPLELRPGERTCISYRTYERKLLAKGKKTVVYSIGASLALRHGLWSGRVWCPTLPLSVGERYGSKD